MRGGVYWQPPADAGHHAQVMLRLPAGEIYDVGAVELDKVNGLVELPLQRGQQRARGPHHRVVVQVGGADPQCTNADAVGAVTLVHPARGRQGLQQAVEAGLRHTEATL